MALKRKTNLTEASVNSLGPPDLKVHESIADTLRLARQEHGQDLRTVSQVLRIRIAYLEAIENGDFEQLPGTAYAIGFLRTYAEFLGLDGEQIIDRFKHEARNTAPQLDLVFPEPAGHNRIPGGALVLISVLLAGLAYGGWFYLSNAGTNIADLMPPLPENLQSMFSGDDDGQAAIDGTMTVAVAGAEATTYTPPESAEAESQAALDTAEPAIAADADTAASENLATLTAPASIAEPEPTQDDAVAPEAAPLAPQIPDPTPTAALDAADVIETPAPEVVAAIAPPAPEVVAAIAPPAPEVVAAIAPPAPEVVTATVAPAVVVSAPSTRSEFSIPTGDSSLSQVARMSRPATATAMVGAIEPLLDETVVIPSPPTATQDIVMPTERSPRIYGENNLGTRIVLRALADSWVQVRDRQDALLLTRVLRNGDTYYVPNQIGLTLLTGNAGGIAIEVDGVTLAPLGPVGAVRRQIALDPTKLLDGTAQPR